MNIFKTIYYKGLRCQLVYNAQVSGFSLQLYTCRKREKKNEQTFFTGRV